MVCHLEPKGHLTLKIGSDVWTVLLSQLIMNTNSLLYILRYAVIR